MLSPNQVQTGFGRTGSHFWGFQAHDVVPDMVTMAKGIANGFPMGAVVTSEGESGFHSVINARISVMVITLTAGMLRKKRGTL